VLSHFLLLSPTWAISIPLTSIDAAQILATPVRTDVDHHRRLPSALLTRFVMKLNPNTTKIHILPDAISTVYGKQLVHGGHYTIGSFTAVHSLGTTPHGRKGRNWMKLAPIEERQRLQKRTMFRSDMAGYVLKMMRERVVEEMVKRGVSWQVDRVEGDLKEWANAPGEVLCLLDFRPEKNMDGGLEVDSSSTASEISNATTASVDPPLWPKDTDTIEYMFSPHRKRKVDYTPPPIDPSGLIAEVNGKLVPVHPIRRMLCEELTQKIMKDWHLIPGSFPIIALTMTPRTLQMQIWLMKLRAYLDLYYTQPEKNQRVV
jgi:hypothetical protein